MPSIGYIKARAYTSKAGIPVQGVTVTFERKLEQGAELLSVQQTDRSGMTQTVAVPTPDADMSRTQDKGQGWTDVSVYADAPQYERISAEDVQVFPDVTTVQNLELIPLSEIPEFWSQTQQFITTPQPL